MRPKTLLAGLLALTALGAPAATASAADNTFDGTCDILGIAKFDSLLTANPAPNQYHFLSGDPTGGSAPDTSECSGTLNGVQVDKADISAFVNGSGNLSCGASNSDKPGIGGVTFRAGNVSLGIALSFVGTLSEVTLQVTGSKSGTAGGNASFRDYIKPDQAAQECNGTDVNGDGKAGYSQLGFHAILKTFTPLTSAGAPTNPSGGGGGSTGGGGSGGGSTGTGTGGGGGSTSQVSVAMRAIVAKLSKVLRTGIPVKLSATAPVRASLVAQLDPATARKVHLSRRPIVIGRKVVNLTRPGRTTARIPLTAKARRKLAGRRRIPVKVVGTIRDVTGRTRTMSSRVVLR